MSKQPEHICNGGTWNNQTKQFECWHSDKQSELEELLDSLAIKLRFLKYEEAKQAILDWHNKQVKNAFTDFYSQHYETIDLNPSLARAFSNKLKESTDV